MVALGGAVGAMGRYFVASALVRVEGFPWATLTVNVTGSFFMGLLAGLVTAAWSASPAVRLFLMVGVLGGYTTFSAFSLEVVSLTEQGRWDLALLYTGLSVVLCVAGLACGLWLARLVAS